MSTGPGYLRTSMSDIRTYLVCVRTYDYSSHAYFMYSKSSYIKTNTLTTDYWLMYVRLWTLVGLLQ